MFTGVDVGMVSASNIAHHSLVMMSGIGEEQAEKDAGGVVHAAAGLGGRRGAPERCRQNS